MLVVTLERTYELDRMEPSPEGLGEAGRRARQPLRLDWPAVGRRAANGR